MILNLSLISKLKELSAEIEDLCDESLKNDLKFLDLLTRTLLLTEVDESELCEEIGVPKCIFIRWKLGNSAPHWRFRKFVYQDLNILIKNKINILNENSAA